MDNEKNFIIYIPGLFSSYLSKGNDIIWPIVNKEIIKLYFTNYVKNPLKNIFLNNRNEEDEQVLSDYLFKLSDKNLKPSGLTKNNDNIINLIKKHTNDKNFFIFTYDWRESFDVTIDLLDKNINNLHIPNKNITLISHSAGGIIGYKYVNNIVKYGKSVNFKKINKFITIGCPIEGSIKALSVIMGLYHQSVLTQKNIEEILNQGFFKSIYELIPANIQNLFFYKNTKKILTGNEIVTLLLNNGFSEETIRKSSEFREEMNNLLHNHNINFLFIVGIYTKEPMCVGFEVDPETKEITPIYDYGSDGTVLCYEAMPTLTHRFRIRYVQGKHMYLTEYDETLNIIEKELTSAEEGKHVVFAKPIKTDNNTIEFYLYIIIDKKKYLVKDIRAEKILFTHKINVQDITKSIKHNKKQNRFYFNSIYKFGVLKFKNIIIYYDKTTETNLPVSSSVFANNNHKVTLEENESKHESIVTEAFSLEEISNDPKIEQNNSMNNTEPYNSSNNYPITSDKQKTKEFFKNLYIEINKPTIEFLF